jgi:hypothetical protein
VHPYTKDQRLAPLILLIVSFTEVVCRYARRTAEILKEPLLWPIVLLFLPKINLVGVHSETAGIRFDDLILLLLAGAMLIEWIGTLKLTMEPLPLAGFAVVTIFCFSNLVNHGIGHSSIFYSLRLVEYMIFYWSGRRLIQSGYDFELIMKLLVVLNCAVAVLQFFGLIGGFTSIGYQSDAGRPFGLSANHPAEMAAMLNLLFAALVFSDKPIKFWRWSLIVGFFVFLTGSRSSLVAHSLLMLVYVYKHSKSKIKFALTTVYISGLLVAIIAAVPNAVTSRSADLFSLQNVDIVRDVYNSIPVDRQFSDVSEGGLQEDSPEGVDVSWYQRGYKWALVTKTMFAQSWAVWILGVGPGGIGIALDGGWLRVIVETGIVGTIAFLFLLRRISQLSTACSMAVFALAVNMFMIDSHLAYKVMAFLFLLTGIQVQRNLDRHTGDDSIGISELRRS